ncbi:MAG: response regulator, partial [bacterium]
MANTKKILVVDDDENLVEAVKATLLSKNYAVVTAYDGEEGIRKVKEEKPDLIILDIMMDKKHGYDVCAELKRDPQFSSIPIIILTGVG